MRLNFSPLPIIITRFPDLLTSKQNFKTQSFYWYNYVYNTYVYVNNIYIYIYTLLIKDRQLCT